MRKWVHYIPPPPEYENTKNVILLLSKVKWENNNYHFMEPKKGEMSIPTLIVSLSCKDVRKEII